MILRESGPVNDQPHHPEILVALCRRDRHRRAEPVFFRYRRQFLSAKRTDMMTMADLMLERGHQLSCTEFVEWSVARDEIDNNPECFEARREPANLKRGILLRGHDESMKRQHASAPVLTVNQPEPAALCYNKSREPKSGYRNDQAQIHHRTAFPAAGMGGRGEGL